MWCDARVIQRVFEWFNDVCFKGGDDIILDWRKDIRFENAMAIFGKTLADWIL